jgi:uncharacterized LabA/DUF88 family protein
MPTTRRKTIIYIDGFNLFHALKEMRWKKYYWLDLVSFSNKLLAPVQVMKRVRYFTSRGIDDPHGQKRQNTYIEALETLKDLDIQYGKFTSDDWGCSACGKIQPINHEKQTDVNMAVAMISDAQDENFDDAILITADSDQVPTVSYITNAYPNKRIIVAFPPGRHSNDLQPVATKTFHIGRREIEESQGIAESAESMSPTLGLVEFRQDRVQRPSQDVRLRKRLAIP